MEKQLEGANGPVEVVNSNGTVLGVFTLTKPPHSRPLREELERRREEARKHPKLCRPLTDFWAEMEKRHGGTS